MPESANITMKTIKLTGLLLFSPLYFFAQSLTGLWTGKLSNDSSTIRKDQSYEIALTEYRGKVYGYSRSEFIVNDTLYYIVKRVKGTINGNVCEVKDDDIISYNFRGKLDKGVKVVNTFRLNELDSSWHLDGDWKTNSTKRYYALTGKVALEEEKDFAQSKLFPHLEELSLEKDVAFYVEQKQNEKKQQVVAVKKEEPTIIIDEPLVNKEDVALQVKKESLATTNTDIQKTNNSVSITTTEVKQPVIITDVAATQANEKPEVIDEKKNPDNALTKANAEKQKPAENKSAGPVVQPQPPVSKKEEPVVVKNQSVPEIKKQDIAKNNPPADIKQSTAVLTKAPEKKEPAIQQNETKKTGVASNTTLQNSAIATKATEEKKEPVITTNTDIQKTNPPASITTQKQTVANPDGAATEVNKRKSEFAQEVTFKSDSLQLALYDNGEIDGDTVSVLLNGEILLPKQGLKASAIRKTIYITPEIGDSLVIVLYAENLGKYPPNTGLLVVRDGDDVYNVRFSADFQRNAAIVLRRKK